MYLEVRRNPRLAQVFGEGAHHVADIPRQVLERPLQLVVVHHPLETGGHAFAAARVVGAVGGARRRFLVLDVFGRDGGPHEDEIVVEVRAVQDPRADRVEEGLGQLGLVVLGQQADVVQLDLLPDAVLDPRGVILVLKDHRGLAHALVIERDAVTLELLQPVPIPCLEAQLGRVADLAEQPVVLVEAVQHGPRHIVGNLRREQLGEVRHGRGRRLRCGKGSGNCKGVRQDRLS
ncbi:hypothetical protein D3C87_1331440 [compost metagenome]